MNAPAPTEEAKHTARQLRDVLKECNEHAIDNEWDKLRAQLQIAEALAEHLRGIEATQKRFEVPAAVRTDPAAGNAAVPVDSSPGAHDCGNCKGEGDCDGQGDCKS